MSLLGNLTVGILGNMSGLSGDLRKSQTEVQKFAKNVQNLGQSITNVGRSMSLWVTGPLVGLGTAALAAGNDFDKAMQDIRVSSGATGDLLETLEADFRSVFAEIPTSSEAAANVIANLNTLTAASGEVLQDMTKSVLEASRMLGEDGVANSQAFGKAMQQWQRPAEDGTEILDYLFKMTQDYGISLSGVTGHLNTYGSVLQNAGFTMEQSAELFSRMSANGIAVSRIMPGLNRAFRNWASEGKNSQEELQKVIDSMVEAEDATVALGIATDVFGAEGAQRLTTAIRNGAFPAIEELGSGLEDVSGLIMDTAEENKTFADSMLEIRNQIQLLLEPLGATLLEAFRSLLPYIEQAIGYLQQLADWFTNLSPRIQSTILIVAGLAAALGPVLLVLGPIVSSISTLIPLLASLTGPIGLVAAGLAALVAAGVALYRNWETVKERASGVFEAFGPLFETLKGAFQDFMDSLQPIWESLKQLFESLKPILTAVGALVAGVLVTALGLLISTLSAVVSAIGPLINAVINLLDVFVNIFNAIIALIRGDFSGALEYWIKASESSVEFFKNLWKAVENFFKTFVKTIIDFFKGLYKTLVGNSIIPDLVKGIVKWITDLGKWVGDLIRKMVDNVRQHFERMRENIRAALEAAKKIVQSVLEFVRNTFKNAIDFVSSLVRGDFEGMRNAVQNQMENIRNTIRNIWNTVMDFFKKINLYDIGKDIIQGLINGIKGMAQSAANAARDVAKNVGDSVKNFFSIRSPSRLMMEYGEDIGEGLIVGLERMTRMLQRVTDQLSAAAFIHFPNMETPAISVSGEGFVSETGSRDIALHVPVYLDGEVVTEVVSHHQASQATTAYRGEGMA